VSGRTPRRDASAGLVPLADRVRWSTWLRLGLVTVVAAAWVLLPQARSGDERVLAAVGAGYAVLSLLVVAAPRVGRTAALWAVNAGTAFDSVLLAAAFYGLGGLQGPVVACFALHASALCLLFSFRTGVRAALGHSLLVLCVVQAGSPLDFPEHEYLVFLLQLWLATTATSSFAAVNERELRRRRYDAEVVNRFLAELETVVGVRDIAARLAELCGEELLVRRAVVVHRSAAPGFHVDGWSAAGPVAGDLPAGWDAGSPALLSATSAEPVLRWRLDGDALGQVLPDAGGVVVLALTSGSVSGGGWLVLELGARRRAGVERRLLSTAGQAASHTALALSRARAVAALRRAADSDGLTGVRNRRWFDQRLASEFASAAGRGVPLAVALVDLDHFKQVNDVHGHQAGDEVLVRAAASLGSAARGSDQLARYGGEEFVLLLPGAGPAEALEVAERLRQAVASGAGAVSVTCSIGVAVTGGPLTSSPGELVRAADEALYRAKEQGRDRCVLAAPPSAPGGTGRRAEAGPGDDAPVPGGEPVPEHQARHRQQAPSPSGAGR